MNFSIWKKVRNLKFMYKKIIKTKNMSYDNISRKYFGTPNKAGDIARLNNNIDEGEILVYVDDDVIDEENSEIIRNLFRNDDIIFITDGFAHNAIPKEILADEIAKHLPTAKIKPINLIQINEFKEKDVIEGIKICCGSFYLCSQLF